MTVLISHDVHVKEFHKNWFIDTIKKYCRCCFGYDEYIEEIKFNPFDRVNYDKEIEDISLLKKSKKLYIIDELLDNDPRTDGFFASRIGIHGNNPKKWRICNRKLAYEKVPELAKYIENKQQMLLKIRVIYKWKGFVMIIQDIKRYMSKSRLLL